MKNVDSTYYIESYGCTLNSGDAEIIMFKFEELGYTKVENFKDAKFIVINTCGVKTPTEQKILYRIKHIAKLIGNSESLIITGCLPIILKESLTKITSIAPNFAALIGPKNYHELEEILSKVLMGERNIIKIGCQTLTQKVSLKSKPLMKNIGILPIAEGCKGACSYCCTRFARGHLQSYPISSIKEKLNRFIKKGIKEIWITGT
jgi:tRNA A37 methylthiotransferase MiaB